MICLFRRYNGLLYTGNSIISYARRHFNGNIDEVSSALRKMDAGKNPGKDGTKTKHLKAGCYFSLKAVTE